jgi:predicted TIM-barrel fold metal-dependent hydrolase
MAIWDERKIDCHNHVLDPVRFPFQPDTPYRPSGQEIAPVEQLVRVLDAAGVGAALIVGPNSGYATDNRCLLHAIEHGGGRFKGIAVVPHDITVDDLAKLQEQGIVGVAFNPSALGVAFYLGTRPLLGKLEDLGMFLQLQTEGDQMVALMPLLENSKVRVLIDHCGRPDLSAGLHQPGFQATLELGRRGRASVKLSGYDKFSVDGYPYRDAEPFVEALVEAFTLDRCMWGSDWPYLKATRRLDYSPLVKLVEVLFPNPADRDKLFWKTPQRLFGFAA